MKILFALSRITFTYHGHLLFFQEKFDYLNLGITCFSSFNLYICNVLFFFNNFIEVEFVPSFLFVCFVIIVFFFFLAAPCGMWGLNSQTRDQTCAPCSGSTKF